MPAVPAIPTTEYSSAAKTFSISRWAIIAPIVARRSPAMTMPPSKVSATIVVACGKLGTSPGGRSRCPGKRCGEYPARNSTNEDVPGAVKAAGNRPWWSWLIGGSLAALLHEPAHEGLGVRLEDIVDLVEEGVNLGFPHLVGGCRGRGRLRDVRVLALDPALLLLGHECLPGGRSAACGSA